MFNLELNKYLSHEEIREALKEGCVAYAKQQCKEFLSTDDKHYHNYFVKVIIDYIEKNHSEQLENNVQCALNFAKYSFMEKTYDGKNNLYVDKLLKFIEEDKVRWKEVLLRRLKDSNEERLLEIFVDAISSFMYSLNKK